jgi:hypothetical protein
MVQITRNGDLPLHYEASPLGAVFGAVGWPVGIVAIVGGIAAFVRADSVAAEALSALFVVVGCALVVLLVRCRRYEVAVGERMTELRLGPFRRTLPTGCVTDAAEQPATLWRRFFAPRELVLTLSVETRPLIIPTRDPDDLRAALTGCGFENESPTPVGGEIPDS